MSEERSTLPGKALRALRALGNELKPTVLIGKEGLSDGIVETTGVQLLSHELIKVRLAQGIARDRTLRTALARELASRTASDLVQLLGHTILLYRRHPTEPRINL